MSSGKQVLRRDALAFLGALAGLVVACGRPPAAGEPRSATAPAPPLVLDPIVDLVPAAGLLWMLDARPRELVKDPILGPTLAAILPGSRLDAFAERHGGLDVRAASQLVVANYPQATLVLARLPFDAGRLEGAFGTRVGRVEGRTVERGVTRMWGSVAHSREQLALLAPDAFAFEHGQFGPLRAAVFFAEGRLRRSRPALRAEPLASAASAVGDAPLRLFASGPFEGEWARAAAGLLGASTAVAATVRAAAAAQQKTIALRLVLMGAWGPDGAAAAERLRAAFNVFAEDALGHVLGIDHPVEGPTVAADADALRLEITLDAEVLSRGIHIATDATVAEIMGM